MMPPRLQDPHAQDPKVLRNPGPWARAGGAISAHAVVMKPGRTTNVTKAAGRQAVERITPPRVPRPLNAAVKLLLSSRLNPLLGKHVICGAFPGAQERPAVLDSGRAPRYLRACGSHYQPGEEGKTAGQPKGGADSRRPRSVGSYPMLTGGPVVANGLEGSSGDIPE
jgi:hypothetical protein